MKAVFVFCEGEHDIAFLCRTLIATGDFERDEMKIAQFPEFFKDLLTKRFQERAVEQTDAQHYSKLKPPVLWDAIRPKNDGLNSRFWFFSACGENQHKAVGEFIRRIRIGLKDRRERNENTGISAESFAFLYDADEAGEQVKLEKWHQNYSMQFPGIVLPSQSAWQRPKDSEDIELGVYILRGTEQMTGELEDIVLPLMRRQNESLYEEATTFVEKHWMPESAKKKMRKAAITVAGQIHYPSYSMAVILRDKDNKAHLKDDALNADPSCQRIVQFFRQVYGMSLSGGGFVHPNLQRFVAQFVLSNATPTHPNSLVDKRFAEMLATNCARVPEPMRRRSNGHRGLTASTLVRPTFRVRKHRCRREGKRVTRASRPCAAPLVTKNLPQARRLR